MFYYLTIEETLLYVQIIIRSKLKVMKAIFTSRNALAILFWNSGTVLYLHGI